MVRRGGGEAFQKTKKIGQYFYENCSILYKMSFNLAPLQMGINPLIIRFYKDNKVWYEKCC